VTETGNTHRAAHAAALFVLGAAAWASSVGCESQRLSTKERLSLTSDVASDGTRTVVIDESSVIVKRTRMMLTPVTQMPWDGQTLPLVSPDGRKMVVQTSGTATWAERVGDPLGPEGFTSRMEAVSLAGDTPGLPLSRLDGPWVLGRGASDEGYLVERPRNDGGRDIAMQRWSGSLVPIVQDEWCNAFATVARDGTLAWSRRDPEGGDWQLVCRRDGVTRVLDGAPGSSWLMPVFGGDGTGMFAFRLEGGLLVVAWLPFAADGLPAADATRAPAMLAVVSLKANLTWVVRALAPVSGLAASPPTRERVAFWVPDAGRMALWAPGGSVEQLLEGSFAATVVDADNALVTMPDALMRERLGASKSRAELMASGAWITRPTTMSAGELVAFRTARNRLDVARLVLNPEAPADSPAPASNPR